MPEFPFLCYLLLEYQSDSFVFQNCMYYIHHYTALKKHSIYIHIDMAILFLEAALGLTESQIDQYWN